MHIEVIIGANYGDEGKGLITEFRCRNNSNPIVVLSNGGCQRGHTVNNIEKNIRHVFHHFGSGTLLNVPSIYANTYLLNPIKFIEEHKELVDVGINPIAYRAPGCILQLPVDMFVNQQLEKHRNAAKHGSCGWGIWETLVRNAKRNEKLTFKDFESFDYRKKKSIYLSETESHICSRLIANNIDFDKHILDIIINENFVKHFIDDFEQMAKEVKCLESDNLLINDYRFDVNSIVVENAQGLLLDMKYAPKDKNGCVDIHTTPSKCGLEGALEALGDDVCLDDVSTFYVSRTYLTRHGEGPFPEEDTTIKLNSFNDMTNIYNEYQGSIRYGRLTIDAKQQLMKRIYDDSCQTNYNLVFTHCNVIDANILPNMLDRGNIYCSFDEDSRHILTI